MNVDIQDSISSRILQNKIEPETRTKSVVIPDHLGTGSGLRYHQNSLFRFSNPWSSAPKIPNNDKFKKMKKSLINEISFNKIWFFY